MQGKVFVVVVLFKALLTLCCPVTWVAVYKITLLRSLGLSGQLLCSARCSRLPLSFRLLVGTMGHIFASALGIGSITGGTTHRRKEKQVKTCKYWVLWWQAGVPTLSRDSSEDSPPGPLRVLDSAGFAFVLQAAAVEAALRPLTQSTRVVRQGAAATGRTVSPGWKWKNSNKHKILKKQKPEEGKVVKCTFLMWLCNKLKITQSEQNKDSILLLAAFWVWPF